MSTPDAYESFNTSTVIEYIKQNNIALSDAAFDCEEIGDGNLNYVFRICGRQSGESIIVKQALPYAKVVGESWPLSLQRATIEAEYLKYMGKFVPDLVPTIYKADPTQAVTVMEDLSDHVILRKGLVEGKQYPKLAEDIGRYMAQTLFHTSDFGMSQTEKKELQKQYINPDLCKITEDLVFTDPFFEHDTNDFPVKLQDTVESLRQDTPLKQNAAQLKYKFLTEAQALVHGDLHSGSIFVRTDQTKVIDPEFAYFGPIGFDIGQFIANLMMNYHAQQARMADPVKRREMQEYLTHTIRGTWNTFRKTFIELWQNSSVEVYAAVPGYADQFIANVFADAIGFAGCEMIRRTIGLAHVEDIDGIVEEEARLAVSRSVIGLGRRFILERHTIHTIDEWIQALKEEHH